MSNEDISVNSEYNSDVVVKDSVDDKCSSYSSYSESSAASDDKDRNQKIVAFELVSSMGKFKRKRTRAGKKTKVDAESPIMVQVELEGKSKLIPLVKDELTFAGFVKFVKQAFSIPEGSILAFEYLARETWFPLEVDIDINACSFYKNAQGFAYVRANK
ncbi:hypothetical protein QVD17_18654 [Tagetes erecta]|uniref:Uncharacterized protein n=1 Tax=Tagetes erecta TaxID=13708 RepID=A0AAD8KPJ4_TARER|nr:hypothetical protein QVD17_18654 [Tagetes erecta]